MAAEEPRGLVVEGACGCTGILDEDGGMYMSRCCWEMKILGGVLPVPFGFENERSFNERIEQHVEDMRLGRPLDIEDVPT